MAGHGTRAGQGGLLLARRPGSQGCRPTSSHAGVPLTAQRPPPPPALRPLVGPAAAGAGAGAGAEGFKQGLHVSPHGPSSRPTRLPRGCKGRPPCKFKLCSTWYVHSQFGARAHIVAHADKPCYACRAYVADQHARQVAHALPPHVVHAHGPAIVGVFWLADQRDHLQRGGNAVRSFTTCSRTAGGSRERRGGAGA